MAIDWASVEIEAVDILRRYLRIDTRNPPGNEVQAARFLGALLEAEGIRCDYLETGPGREILVARIPGDGSSRPLMLANHEAASSRLRKPRSCQLVGDAQSADASHRHTS